MNKIISLIKFNENDKTILHRHIINHTNINEGQKLIVPSLIKINRLLLWM